MLICFLIWFVPWTTDASAQYNLTWEINITADDIFRGAEHWGRIAVSNGYPTGTVVIPSTAQELHGMRDITFEVTTSGTVKLTYDFVFATFNSVPCYFKDAVGKKFTAEIPYGTSIRPAAGDASRVKKLYASEQYSYRLICGGTLIVEGLFNIEFTAYDGTPQTAVPGSSPFSHSFTSDFIGTASQVRHNGLRVHAYGTNAQEGNPTAYTLVDPDVLKTGAETRHLSNDWGIGVTVFPNSSWAAWRLGGAIYGSGSRVDFVYNNNRSGNPPCFLPDYCIMIGLPNGAQFRKTTQEVVACSLACVNVTVTVNNVTENPAAPAEANVSTMVTMNAGSGEVVEASGKVTKLSAGQSAVITGLPPTLVAAVAPNSRSVQVPTTATAFATILNAGPGTAWNCMISRNEAQGLPIRLDYQTTDPNSNLLTGTANTPVDIPAPPLGGVKSQTFVISLKPVTSFVSTDVQINYTCNGSDAVTTLVGINTLLLSASSDPVPDHITVGLTPSKDGVARIPGAGATGVFVIASTNIGISSATTARVRLSDPANMPISVLLCETTGQPNGSCKQPPASTVTRSIGGNENTTWTAFLQAQGPVTLDPAKYRVYFEFLDGGGVTRGSTSTAITTQ
jgi:hypothetical protein